MVCQIFVRERKYSLHPGLYGIEEPLFKCDPDALYVLRVRNEDNGLSLLVNKSMVMNESVRAAMDGEESTDAE